MKVELISHTNNPIMTCAIAASMCYQSQPSVAVVKQCIASGHHSVLEHCSFTFKITNVSRTLLAQLTRHRLASFSVESQRYCSMGEFEVPPLPKGNGQKRHGSCILDTNQETFLMEQYNKGFSMDELAQIYDIASATTVKEIIRKQGGTLRTIKESKFINSNYFDSIDSAIKAYILGFIYTDGCVCVRKDGPALLSITQLEEQHILMSSILQELKSNNAQLHKDREKSCRVQIADQHLCETLMTYGVVVRKGLRADPTDTFNKIPPEYYKDFIRGIVDGDGSIYINPNKPTIINLTISGTYATCDGIQKVLNAKLGLTGGSIYHNVNKSYHLEYCGGQQVRKIIQYLYSDIADYPFFVHSRKLNKIEQLCPVVYAKWKDAFVQQIEQKAKVVFPQPLLKTDNATLFTTAISFYKNINTYDEVKKNLALQGVLGARANENARAILPNATQTNLVMTVNLRELAAMCNLRLCNNAQLEIRNLFYKIKDLLETHPDFDENDQEIFKILLVPNCEKHQYAFCTEAKCCGRHKQLSTLLADNVNAKKRW